MDIEHLRYLMIEQQLRPWGVLDTEMLASIHAVKRELFVPAQYRGLAFVDSELPIGAGQVQLQPKVEARLCQAAQLKKTDTVLEIGTGSGYMAALLAYHCAHVDSYEINPELAQTAAGTLQKNAVVNVQVNTGDGFAAQGQYDVIVLSGSVAHVPAELFDLLNIGGRIVSVEGEAPMMVARRYHKHAANHISETVLFDTVLPRLHTAPAPQFVF